MVLYRCLDNMEAVVTECIAETSCSPAAAILWDLHCQGQLDKIACVVANAQCKGWESSSTPLTFSSIWGSPSFDQGVEPRGVCIGGVGAGGGPSDVYQILM